VSAARHSNADELIKLPVRPPEAEDPETRTDSGEPHRDGQPHSVQFEVTDAESEHP